MPDTAPLTKTDVARRLLGTSLQIFLKDLDPVSAHTLAGAGCELTEHLARTADVPPFIEHALEVNDGLTKADFYALSRKFYNAFKHATDRAGNERDDAELLATFDDSQNDALLFIAWTDFTAASSSTPIEAQVYQAWFYARFPEKMARQEDALRFGAIFPTLRNSTRKSQKQQLNDAIEHARTLEIVMNDPRTDPRPLMIPLD